MVVGFAVLRPRRFVSPLNTLPSFCPKMRLVSFQSKEKPAEVTLVLASRVVELTISSQSIELEAGIWSSVPQEKVPFVVSQRSLDVAESQSPEKAEPRNAVAEA